MYKKQQTQQQKQLANEMRGKFQGSKIGSKKYVDLTKKNSDFTDSITINESITSSENIETSELNSSHMKKRKETKSSRKDMIQSNKLGSKIGSKNNMNVNYIGEIENNEKIMQKMERSAK